MQRVTVIKLDNSDIKSILAEHFHVTLDKVKSSGYSFEIIDNENKNDKES